MLAWGVFGGLELEQGPIFGGDTPVLSSQKPILLQGHERSITQIKYNREGDLLFTVAKDPVSVGRGRAGGTLQQGPRGGEFTLTGRWVDKPVLPERRDHPGREHFTGKTQLLVEGRSSQEEKSHRPLWKGDGDESQPLQGTGKGPF